MGDGDRRFDVYRSVCGPHICGVESIDSTGNITTTEAVTGKDICGNCIYGSWEGEIIGNQSLRGDGTLSYGGVPLALGESNLAPAFNLGYTVATALSTQGLTAEDATIFGTLCATIIDATSAFVKVIDITQYELTGFDVNGDFTISGKLSANDGLSATGGNIYFSDDVGIGTNRPGTTLHVCDTDPRIRVDATAGNHPGFEFSEAGSRCWLMYNQPDNSDALTFKSSADRVVITQAGNVGIGTISPGQKLTVAGTISAQSGVITPAVCGTTSVIGAAVCGTTSVCSPQICGTTKVQGPAVCGTTSVCGAYFCSTGNICAGSGIVYGGGCVCGSNVTDGYSCLDGSGNVCASYNVIAGGDVCASSGTVCGGSVCGSYVYAGGSQVYASSIPNACLANSSVSYGGVSVALGASDATPAFTLGNTTVLGHISATGGLSAAAVAGTSYFGGNVGIGTTAPTEKLSIATNTDVSAEIGRAHVGYIGHSDYAGFSHIDRNNTTSYALIQQSNGATYLNARAAKNIYFLQGGSTKGGFNTSSDFYIDTDTLYVDASEDKVGINTDAPDEALHVFNGSIDTRGTNVENSTVQLYFDANNGDGGGTSNDLGPGITWKPEYSGYSKRSAGILLTGEGNYFRSGLAFFTNDTSDVSTDWSERMRISMEGNVGIGAPEPSAKLTVAGGISASNGLSAAAVAGTSYIGGNLGIGGAQPDTNSKLTVAGNISALGTLSATGPGVSYFGGFVGISNDSNHFDFPTAGDNEAGLHIKSKGDVSLTLEGDTDNSGESDNPKICLIQDGGAVEADIFINGNVSTGYRIPANSFVLRSGDNYPMSLGVNNYAYLTITTDGHVGIGAPYTNAEVVERLTVGGNISARGSIKASQTNYTTIADAAEMAWDACDGHAATVTLGGNRALHNPSNLAQGSYLLKVVQDGTGSRTLSTGFAYHWPGGVAPTLTTTAAAVDVLTFWSDGTNLYGGVQYNFSLPS